MVDNTKQKIYLFIIIPICTNCILLGLYYSGIKELQQIIAPTIDFLAVRSWREFGLVEQLQNICLLSTSAIFLRAFIKRKRSFEKLFFLILSLLFLFLLLEEIDYGKHFYELIKGEYSGENHTNLHNLKIGANDYGHYLKQFMDLTTVLWFIILPILVNRIKTPIVKCLLPTRYFIIGFLLTFVFSQIAHFLDSNNFGAINGVEGNLVDNISEFRELNTYYLYFLYGVQIVKSSLYFTFQPDAIGKKGVHPVRKDLT